MLKDIRIYASDNVWKKILIDLGAMCVPSNDIADVDFDALGIDGPISNLELRTMILAAADEKQKIIIRKVFGSDVSLSNMHTNIVTTLARRGPMTIGELKSVLGFSPDIATHAIDAAIYSLRKTYGRDFIKNENGKYFIVNVV